MSRWPTPIQQAAAAVGIVFLLVGILGFVPGITTNYDDLGFVDPSGAKLLGLFEVNILHNIVHLLFGVAGLALAASVPGSRSYLIGGGVVYLVVFLYGLVVDKASDANFIAVNGADNVLHVVLGVGMIALGLVLARSSTYDRRTLAT